MCSNFAVFGVPPLSAIVRERARRCHRQLRHRGRDQSGEVDVSPHVYLASNRLALIGVGQDGRMPFKSADGKIWLILNGTIYNYRFLKEELKAQGHSFATQSDTEVVLQSHVRWGPNFVDK